MSSVHYLFLIILVLLQGLMVSSPQSFQLVTGATATPHLITELKVRRRTDDRKPPYAWRHKNISLRWINPKTVSSSGAAGWYLSVNSHSAAVDVGKLRQTPDGLEWDRLDKQPDSHRLLCSLVFPVLMSGWKQRSSELHCLYSPGKQDVKSS